MTRILAKAFAAILLSGAVTTIAAAPAAASPAAGQLAKLHKMWNAARSGDPAYDSAAAAEMMFGKDGPVTAASQNRDLAEPAIPAANAPEETRLPAPGHER